MTADNCMQFFLSKPVDPLPLLRKLEESLGMSAESIDHPNPEGKVFLQSLSYPEGQFPVGIGLSWRPGLRPLKNDLEVARDLALHFGIRVVSDWPPQHPLGKNPSVWCLVEPFGQLYEIKEDLDFAQSGNGLLLDEKTRRALKPEELRSPSIPSSSRR